MARVASKTCTRCGESKTTSFFGLDRHKADGLATICKSCRNARQRRNQKRTLPPGDPRHGTVNGASNYGCTCGPCRQVRSDDRAKYNRDARQAGLPVEDLRHGTQTGYARGCKCDPCREAGSRYQRKKTYNFTDAQEEAFQAATHCELCGGPFHGEQSFDLRKVVDHDHSAGWVRGFIHDRCNKTLYDGECSTEELLRQAKAKVAYLSRALERQKETSKDG